MEKKREKKRFSSLALVITAVISVICSVGLVVLAAWLLLGASGLSVLQGIAEIRTQFVGEYDEDAMADAALGAMVESLGDRWSYYLDPDSYAATLLTRDNTYAGIGVTVTYTEKGLEISEITDGGPAQQAGLEVGETITAADGTDLTGENASQGTDLIRGEAGTDVVLTVVDAQGESRQVTVTRAILKTKTVTYEMLENDIGYIAVSNFYTGSAEAAEAAVDDLISQGAKSLIFDMRNNPGGYQTELTDLMDYLLPEGPILEKGNRNGPTSTVVSDADCVDVPMAVLVNGNTYSAAELFAAELQEKVGAYIVGSPTSGKGYSQQLFVLIGSRALNLSTRTYYTGSGVSLIGTGVTLDLEIESEGDEDAPLAAAIDLLQEQTETRDS